MSGPNLNYGYSGLEDNDCLLFQLVLYLRAEVTFTSGNYQQVYLTPSDTKSTNTTQQICMSNSPKHRRHEETHGIFSPVFSPLLPNLTLCPTTRIFAKGRETKAVSEGGADTWLGWEGGVWPPP